jgi:hypothetical protein
MKPYPENHASFSPDSCTSCHQPAAGGETPEATVEATTAATPEAAGAATAEPAGGGSGPQPIPHSIVEAAYQDCTACHGTGKLKPYPPSHEVFPNATCAGCHQPKPEQ